MASFFFLGGGGGHYSVKYFKLLTMVTSLDLWAVTYSWSLEAVCNLPVFPHNVTFLLFEFISLTVAWKHCNCFLSRVWFLLGRCVCKHPAPCYQGNPVPRHQPFPLATASTGEASWTERPTTHATTSEESQIVTGAHAVVTLRWSTTPAKNSGVSQIVTDTHAVVTYCGRCKSFLIIVSECMAGFFKIIYVDIFV